MKLSDTQAMLLSKAAQHPQGLVAPPVAPPAPRAQIERKLLGADLMEEIEGRFSAEFAWRYSNGPTGFYRITAAGLRAIGVDPAEDSTAADDAVQHHRPEQAEAPTSEIITMSEEEKAEAAEAQAIIEDAGQDDGEAGGAPLPKKSRGIASRAVRKAVRKAQAEAEAAADRGELPEPPDFSAATHAPYRKRLEKLVEMAKAGDADGLRGVAINPTSTSPRALIRYRDLCIRAIEARAKEGA